MRALTLAFAVAASAACGPAAATVFAFDAYLSGPAEAPPNTSPGLGLGKVFYDEATQMMSIDIFFQGLTGPTTAAHIHAPTTVAGTGTAGVATTTPNFTGFPLGVTAGTYFHVFDMSLASSYNPAFLNNPTNLGSTATASATLLTAMKDGKSYLNVHTSTFPGGEIRGFLTAVPEPATWALMILGFGMTGGALRSRRRPRGLGAR